ncbi:MAG: HD-GYP domain-containing protein [bacterium]|nr:HD-GYP domain-containing protein [bacterium]
MRSMKVCNRDIPVETAAASPGRAGDAVRRLHGEKARPPADGLLEAAPSGCRSCAVAAVDCVARRKRLTYLQSARALTAAVEAKDPFVRRHSSTVSRYAVGLATRLGLPADQRETLRIAAYLHDIGKIAVPDSILRKRGSLTDAEFVAIKRHPRTSADILRHASFFEDELPIILHHHERFDGSGYPDGLAGERIPLGARILGVADAMDAMLARRRYKPGYPIGRVREELFTHSGTQFDPRIAAVAVKWLDTEPRQFTCRRRCRGPA